LTFNVQRSTLNFQRRTKGRRPEWTKANTQVYPGLRPSRLGWRWLSCELKGGQLTVNSEPMSCLARFALSGRVALVSGAASGLGKAMALALGEAGAELLLADRDANGLEQTSTELQKFGRRTVTLTCDVAEPEQIRQLYVRLDREFGRIDFLGNV